MLLGDHPDAGFAEAQILIRGARRIIVDGWYFDYDVIDAAVWVHRITSSVNTPMLRQDDDADYEDKSLGIELAVDTHLPDVPHLVQPA